MSEDSDIADPKGLRHVKEGAGFQITAYDDLPLEQLRADIFKETGLRMHISWQVGPMVDKGVVDGKHKYAFPFKPIDDEFLEGSATVPLPAPGYVLYVGRFLPKGEASAANAA